MNYDLILAHHYLEKHSPQTSIFDKVYICSCGVYIYRGFYDGKLKDSFASWSSAIGDGAYAKLMAKLRLDWNARTCFLPVSANTWNDFVIEYIIEHKNEL